MPDNDDPDGDRRSPGDTSESGRGRRDRRRLEHEIDELTETVAELREELAALQTATGNDEGESPSTLADLRHQLYHEPTDDLDPGGDVLALQQITAEHTAALEAISVRTPVLPCWAEMDREKAQKAWEQLVDWLCGVLIVRYPSSARELRPCWYLHPELVENLSWLHNAWTLAYRDGNSPISLAADWHLYWLPHVMKIAADATRKCYDAGRHDPTADPDLTTENAVGISEDLDAYLNADLRNRPEPDDQNARGYVVPPTPPTQPRSWSEYRRGPTRRADPPPPEARPTGPPPPGQGGPGHNPYRPR